MLKEELDSEKQKSDTTIFGSGKHLLGDIADDFNEPLDLFKGYRKMNTYPK